MIVYKSLLLTLALVSSTLTLNAGEKYNLATKVSKAEYSKWDISIFPDGKNLPKGSGNYKDGQTIFANKCASCHGENGKGGIKLDPYRGAIATLVKSKDDTLTGDSPHKNIGTYWQHATLLFDYIRRTMPYENPKSLTTHELYSLSAYLLAQNGITSKEKILSEQNLAKIRMPNRDGFICDNHVDTLSLPCMENCLLAGEKGYNRDVIIDMFDYLKSDCLIESKD